MRFPGVSVWLSTQPAAPQRRSRRIALGGEIAILLVALFLAALFS
jgi:hypothetical protein